MSIIGTLNPKAPLKHKLKPCPFCGQTPILDRHYRDNLYRLVHRCTAIGAISLDWGTLESNATRWNTRKQSDG